MTKYHLTFILIPSFSEEVNFQRLLEVCMHGCSTDYLLTVLNICCDEKPWQRKSCLHTGANDWVFQRAHGCVHIPNPTQVKRRHYWCMVQKKKKLKHAFFFLSRDAQGECEIAGMKNGQNWKCSIVCFTGTQLQ